MTAHRLPRAALPLALAVHTAAGPRQGPVAVWSRAGHSQALHTGAGSLQLLAVVPQPAAAAAAAPHAADT